MTIPVIHTRGITITHMNTISRTVPYTASPADLNVSFCVQFPILMMANIAYMTMNCVPMVKLSPAFKDYLWGGTKLRDAYGKQ